MEIATFLKPISCDDGELKYLMLKNRKVSIKNIKIPQNVYIFVKHGYVDGFIHRLYPSMEVNTCKNLPTVSINPGNSKISSINRIKETVYVQTNGANFVLACTEGIHSYNSCLEECFVFVIKIDNGQRRYSVKTILKHLQLSYPFFYILWPFNIEMEFILFKRFEQLVEVSKNYLPSTSEYNILCL